MLRIYVLTLGCVRNVGQKRNRVRECRLVIIGAKWILAS